MKIKIIYPLLLYCLVLVISSCESEVERKQRLAKEEQQRIELKEKLEVEESERAFKLERERIEQEARLEKERQEKTIYDKYINNSLSTGSTPFAYCFGKNSSCSGWGCSEIKVLTPYNSDVLVTIKKDEMIVRHAFINKNSTYTFELPNGTYQPFFYYGKGWNPEKIMKQTTCGTLKGGFISNEHFGKDTLQILSNHILEYELILQERGNFSTKPSNADEAL